MNYIKNSNTSIIFFAIILLALIQTSTVFAWTYTVQPGDSLWHIAGNTGTSVKAIKTASGVKGDLIMPGQKLNVVSSAAQITSKDKNLLVRIVEAEAGGETYKGKVGVAAVILNRVQDSHFPNTISRVIFQKHAFESVSNGLIWRVNPSRESYKAVEDALKGWDPTYKSVYFWNPYKVSKNSWVWTRPIVTQYSRHVFAK